MHKKNSSAPYIDFESYHVKPIFAAELLEITTQTLKKMEEFKEVSRKPCGSVSARIYTPSDIFELAALRASKRTKRLKRPLTVSTFVQKGGTAKTTCAVNLAIFMALRGIKTLIIDNDPQGDATSTLGYDPDLEEMDLLEMGISPEKSAERAVAANLGHLITPFLGSSSLGGSKSTPLPAYPALESIIKKPFGEYGPHLLPAEESLDDLDMALALSLHRDFRYAKFIDKARKQEIDGCDLSAYDLIIFDNAPSGSALTRNALIASDLLLCPVRMDKFSYRALRRLIERLALFKEEYKRAPEVFAVPTMYIKNRPRMASNLSRLTEIFAGSVCEHTLFYSEDYLKALEEGMPVLLWSKAGDNSKGAINAAFNQLLSRLEAL